MDKALGMHCQLPKGVLDWRRGEPLSPKENKKSSQETLRPGQYIVFLKVLQELGKDTDGCFGLPG